MMDMDTHLSEALAQLEANSARFDLALAAVAQSADSAYTFTNVGFSVCPDGMIEGNIVMVTIVARLDANSPWEPIEESAPPEVDAALRACGLVEEGENGYTIDRPRQDVVRLLTSWGLEEVEFSFE